MWQSRRRRSRAAAAKTASRRVRALQPSADQRRWEEEVPPAGTATAPRDKDGMHGGAPDGARHVRSSKRRGLRAPVSGVAVVDDVEDDVDSVEVSLPPLRRAVANLTDRLPVGVRSALWRLDARGALVVIAIAAIAAGLAFVFFARSPGAVPLPVSAGFPTFAGVTTVATPTPSGGFVVVDVAGAVAKPGVITLPNGSRVVDAIRMAGGALAGTDLTGLNLARVLVDGEQIAVGVPPAAGPPGALGTTAPDAPIDLNSATADDLDALPGIGPVLALRIVSWRGEHGRFTSVDELLEVSGIGAATFADLAALVRV